MRGNLLLILFSGMITLAMISGSVYAAGWHWMQPSMLQSIMKEANGTWLLDVGSPNMFERAHVGGAVNVSLSDIENKGYSKNKVYVLIDTGLGRRLSREAAHWMAAAGYDNVYILHGSPFDWEREGIPVVREKSGISTEVYPRDLLWAMDNGAHLKVIDLRSKRFSKAGEIPSSLSIDGGSFEKRFETLVKEYSLQRKLSERINGPETLVLVFPKDRDAAFYTEKAVMMTMRDIRYLMGGYEAFARVASGSVGKTKTVGVCGTCGAKSQ